MSGKHRAAVPRLRPDALDRVSNEELREALLDKLTVAEINELTRQTEKAIEKARWETAARVNAEAYKRQFAVMMRVLRDRFGFGRKRLRRLWNNCLEYIHDCDAGLVTTEELLKCLKNQDGIELTWEVRLDGDDTV